MVRPAQFGFNSETALNNHFQVKSPEDSAVTNKRALREFDDYVDLLRRNGVEVLVVQDSAVPPTPDSVFPNNWFSTHITGELVLYPMFAGNRRQERKLPALATVGSLEGVTKVINLSSYEQAGLFLEGTGSMVLDRVNRIAYACSSERSSLEVLNEFCVELDYSHVYFSSTDAAGNPIYHTNVMMCVAEEYAVVCLECIRDEAERKAVVTALEQTGHEVIAISSEQIMHFAGNMLEVASDTDESLLLMSAAAKASLTEEQICRIRRHSRILAPDLHTIETNGGGSARCMVAEIFVKPALSAQDLHQTD